MNEKPKYPTGPKLIAFIFGEDIFRPVKRIITPEEFKERYSNACTTTLESWYELEDEIIRPDEIQLVSSLYLGPRRVTLRDYTKWKNKEQLNISTNSTLSELVSDSISAANRAEIRNPRSGFKYFALDIWWGNEWKSACKGEIKYHVLHPTLQLYVPNKLTDLDHPKKEPTNKTTAVFV